MSIRGGGRCWETLTFTLRPTLRDLSKEIHTGRGFVVLRGLHIDKYSREDNIIIYTRVSSYIGSIRGR